MDTSIVPLKECSRCKQLKPQTTEFYPPRTDTPDGLRGQCRQCRSEQRRDWERSIGIKPRTVTRKDGLRRCGHCKEWKPETFKYFQRDLSRPGGYYAWCKTCCSMKHDRRPATSKAREARYREQHREKARLITQGWREHNRERDRANARNWVKTHPTEHKIIGHRYRAKKRELPNAFTTSDWEYALNYFNGCCAVCGRQLNDLFATRMGVADHWIPLASAECPGTIPANMVPLCHGVDGCNSSKRHKKPEVWLVGKFGETQAKRILRRIHAYFAKLQDGASH